MKKARPSLPLQLLSGAIARASSGLSGFKQNVGAQFIAPSSQSDWMVFGRNELRPYILSVQIKIDSQPTMHNSGDRGERPDSQAERPESGPILRPGGVIPPGNKTL